jgi:hypothetical protein
VCTKRKKALSWIKKKMATEHKRYVGLSKGTILVLKGTLSAQKPVFQSFI